MNENYQYQSALVGGIGVESAKAQLMQLQMSNPTIGENIDLKIRQAEDRLQMLKDNKARLEKTGLLDIRIHDLRQVMDY